jgi:ubiquinone/menaquinone biosynthesis C-methylase UbiE
MKKALIAIVIVLSAFISKPEFSYKVYGNVANYFESEKELLDYFEFKKGNNVAEIGSLEGKNIVGFCILTDSVTFYAQDINSKTLNQRSFEKLLSKAEKYKKPISSKTKLIIGNEKESLLPENAFDKIILVNTFHEFSFMNEMLRDIYKKLKPNGKLYILEANCANRSHKNYKVEDAITLLHSHSFKLLKQDGKDLNGGTGVYRLVLSKE